MKRSLYEMLEVSRDADQVQIDAAFALAAEKLNIVTVRGTAAAIVESQLLRDGYLLLSDPGKRAAYDAKLLTEETTPNLTGLTAGALVRPRFGVGTLIVAGLVALAGGIAYPHVSAKMEEVRNQHAQAVKRKAAEQAKVFVIDDTRQKSTAASTAPAQKKP